MTVTWAYNAGTNTATASGAGSTNFAALVAADTAGGWGKFTADASGRQFQFIGDIVVGDGTNATALNDNNKQIITSKGIEVKNHSTITMGILDDLTTHATYGGCSFYSTAGAWSFLFYANSGTSIYLYSCWFGSTNAIKFAVGVSGGAFRIWNCIASASSFINRIYDADVYNLNSQHTTDGVADLVGTPVVDKLIITNSGTCAILIDPNFTGDQTYKNLYVRNCTYLLENDASTIGNIYLINPDVTSWTFYFWATTWTGKVYRQYEFDLTTDVSATVTLMNNAGTQVFSVTSDGTSGAIATQTVSRGYYNQANGNTLQDYGPFTLTITKAGKMPYTQSGIVLTEKTKLLIALRTQLAGNAVVGDVASTKTFYKDDADTQLTGTYTAPTLTGDALITDVVVGKTFYKDDATNKLTGTHTEPVTVLTGTAVEGDVLKGRTFYNTDASTKKTGSLTAAVHIVEKEVPTKKEEYALKLVGVLLEQKELMRKQGGFKIE